MKNIFKFNAQFSKKTAIIIEITGFVMLLVIWYLLTAKIGAVKMNYISAGVQNIVVSDSVSAENLPMLEVNNDTLKSSLSAYKYQWFKNNQPIPNSDKEAIKISEAGTYYVVTYDRLNKAYTSDSLRVNFQKMPIVNKAILPSPYSVLASFKDLHLKDYVVRNTFYSVKLNIYGYLEAIGLALFLGFIIGLFPFFKSLLNRYVEAVRFVPLTAVTGLFIAWFGIETNMKVQFLAFGILVYLLPIVVQRISEVDKIYLQTSFTLGASNWQLFRSVYWPFVTSKIFDDIRVLTAISWTYIIVAELVNKTGGIGALIFTAARQSRIDKVFALLFVIILIGFLQDRLFVWLDKVLFPYKHK